MPLSIQLKVNHQQATKWEFPSDADFISLGRNPECDVKFDPDQTQVGRLHCAIRQRAGDYRLELNRHNLVLVDGEPAQDGKLVVDGSTIKLGGDGPELVVHITALSPDLPPTRESGDPPAGFETVAYQNVKSTRRISRLMMLGLALLIVTMVGLFGVSRFVKEIGLEQRQTSLRLIELDGRTEQQNSVVASLEMKFTGELQDLKNKEQKLIDALNDKAKSVCLVLVQNPDGNFMPQATAWVVDQEQGLMATNAHVASLFNEIDGDSKLLVRTPGETPQDFVIESVEMHPGYSEFDTLWLDYDPVKRTALGQMESVEAASSACDVAILHLKDAVGLPPALQLADDTELAALKPGESVAYIGYPIEGTRLFNESAPSPTTQLGWLTSMTNYFGDDDAEEADRELLVHALPASGGTSGSPVFDRKGNVIAIHSGANVIGWSGNVRLVTSANIYFSQRCDLLRELLAGTAQSAQVERSARWNSTIARYFARRTDQEVDIVEDIIRAWETSLQVDGDYDVTIEPVGEEQRGMDKDHLNESVRLESAGKYHVGILSKKQEAEASYVVNFTRDGETAYEIASGWLALGKMESLPFDILGPGELKIQLVSDDDYLEANLCVDRGKRNLRSAEDRIQDRLKLWQEQIEGPSDVIPRLVLDQEVSIEDGNAVFNLDFPLPGEYLVLVISPEGLDADLTITDGENQLGQDRRYSSLGFFAGDFEEAKQLKAYVAGPAEMTKVRFLIYMAQ